MRKHDELAMGPCVTSRVAVIHRGRVRDANAFVRPLGEYGVELRIDTGVARIIAADDDHGKRWQIRRQAPHRID
jgi:hypothetical protein